MLIERRTSSAVTAECQHPRGRGDVDQGPVVPAVPFRADAGAEPVPGPRRQPAGQGLGRVFPAGVVI